MDYWSFRDFFEAIGMGEEFDYFAAFFGWGDYADDGSDEELYPDVERLRGGYDDCEDFDERDH